MQVTTDTAGDTATSRRPPGAAPARTPRPAPLRVPELHHLELDALRTYRKDLGAEENLVSYWRRILQARLDLVTVREDDSSALDRLRSVLGGEQAQSRRSVLLDTLPLGDSAPLPDLQSLWATAASDDPDELAVLIRRLTDAEAQLSAYRGALHVRLDLATRELIARYYADPLSCLIALPLSR